MTTITIYKTPDVQVVVHRRERPATRDPWAVLIFGGPA